MRVLLRELRGAGIEVLETVYGNTWMLSKSYPTYSASSWQQADIVIINGEGTMHDDAKLAVYYMDEVVKKRTGKKLIFINTLWQRMSATYAEMLAHADLVVVREPQSFRELGLDSAVVMPDLSYYEVPVYGKLPDQEFLKGTFYNRQFEEINLDGTIDITKENWSVLVNKLRHAKACFTGKHHEMIACCIARCPFVTPEISTHKISGLGAYIGINLPELAINADTHTVRKELVKAAKDADGIYKDLFNTMESLRSSIKLKDLIKTTL
jgi:hypothetical protein